MSDRTPHAPTGPTPLPHYVQTGLAGPDGRRSRALEFAEESTRSALEGLRVAEEELALERQRYLDLFQSAPDAYLVTDPEGVVREANTAATRLLCVPLSRMVGKPLSLFVAEKDRRAFRRHLLQLASGDGGSGELEIRMTPRGGEPVPVALRTSALLDPRGDLAELRCLVHDLTERKRLEEHAHALEREQLARLAAERANQIKTDFLSTVSHELRTPLTTIMAYTELMAMGIPVALPEPAQKSVMFVDEAARHLLVLIEELLGFARMEASKESVRKESVDLSQLADETGGFIRPLARKRNLELTIREADRQVTAVTDRAKIRQILINLLSNAVKFTPEGGRVTLELEEADDEVRLHVQDTGIGIEAEHVDRIFDAFWQVQQGPTREVGGTGLGLTISHRLAELIGGRLEVSSIPGVGSCFTLSVPRAAE